MKRFLLILLALGLLAASGCGTANQKPVTNATAAPTRAPDDFVENCFTLTENENGTYSYEVTSRDGTVILEEYYKQYPAAFIPVDNDRLVVYGQNGTRLRDRWAVVCDVATPTVYRHVYNVVGVSKTQAAVVEERTGQYYLFVCDVMDSGNILDAKPLTGLTVMEGAEPDITVKQKNNQVTVTYPTDSGKETVTVELK